MEEPQVIFERLGGLTLEAMDHAAGRPSVFEDTSPVEEDGLRGWHRSIYWTPIRDYEMHDLSRACQQRMGDDVFAPYVLSVLRHDPLAGDLYAGDLLLSLESIPKVYWAKHPDYRRQMLEIIKTALDLLGPEEAHIIASVTYSLLRIQVRFQEMESEN